MAGGHPDDVLRSLRRYVAQTLGAPPWTVRLQRSRVADDQRPVAVIEPQVLGTLFARATIPQGDTRKQQTFTVVCYPTLRDTASGSAEEARMVMAELEGGFTRGLVTSDSPPRNIGGPYRLPLYDFSATPIDGPMRAGPNDPYGFANVGLDLTIRPVQDAMDELRYTVLATVPVTWWASGRVPATGGPGSGPIAVGMPIRWGGEDGPDSGVSDLP